MKKLILIISIILTGCAYKVKTPIQPISFIATNLLDTTKVRYNGYYNKIVDTIVYSNGYKYSFPKSVTNDLIVFNKNKNIYVDDATATKDSLSFNCKYYNEIHNRYKLYSNKFDTFTIRKDSIYTYFACLITVGAGQRVPINCNFRGFIKNKDTIIDWKIIPPYPKDFTKSVKERNKDLFEPHTLYFVKTDAVKCLQMD
jgi:hypothetical protein